MGLIAWVFAPYRKGNKLQANRDHFEAAAVRFLVRVSSLKNCGPNRELIVHKCVWYGGWRGGWYVAFEGTEDCLTTAEWFVLKEKE